ncbi:MAG: deoxyribonuclease IV [Firmicutes bacterium]|nr:deoxyribonuclease IV [Bacillota bacterium]
MKFGCHVSIAGGLDKAIARGKKLGCEAIQIFASNPRGWRVKKLNPVEAVKFKEARAESEIAVVAVHSTYLVNLASANPEIREKSYQRFKEDVERAGEIGAEFMVLHPGSHGGAGLNAGIDLVAEALRRLQGECELKTTVLLEIEAGGGTEIGGTWENLVQIMEKLPEPSDWVGLCLDTCHSFAAGYDLRREEGWEEVLGLIDRLCGLERLKLIHANDAAGSLGDHWDRHAHIGQGSLGEEGFKAMMARPELSELPVVLETPEDEWGNFATNLAALRRIYQERENQ